MAQNADQNTKPIGLTFALVGLYLVNEKGFTGKQVQNIHIALAKANRAKKWPTFSFPLQKASVTVSDFVEIPDSQKQAMIKKWNKAVWEIWKDQRATIEKILAKYLNFVD